MNNATFVSRASQETMSSTSEETKRILELHLGRLLPIAPSSSPEPFPRGTDYADAHQVGFDAAISASLADLTHGLWDLLGLYVASLETTSHCGWSRTEEDTVLHFLALLGWTGATV